MATKRRGPSLAIAAKKAAEKDAKEIASKNKYSADMKKFKKSNPFIQRAKNRK